MLKIFIISITMGFIDSLNTRKYVFLSLSSRKGLNQSNGIFSLQWETRQSIHSVTYDSLPNLSGVLAVSVNFIEVNHLSFDENI